MIRRKPQTLTIEEVRARRAEIDARMTAIHRGEIEPVAIVVKDRGDAVRSIKVVDRRRGYRPDDEK